MWLSRCSRSQSSQGNPRRRSPGPSASACTPRYIAQVAVVCCSAHAVELALHFPIMWGSHTHRKISSTSTFSIHSFRSIGTATDRLAEASELRHDASHLLWAFRPNFLMDGRSYVHTSILVCSRLFCLFVPRSSLLLRCLSIALVEFGRAHTQRDTWPSSFSYRQSGRTLSALLQYIFTKCRNNLPITATLLARSSGPSHDTSSIGVQRTSRQVGAVYASSSSQLLHLLRPPFLLLLPPRLSPYHPPGACPPLPLFPPSTSASFPFCLPLQDTRSFFLTIFVVH